jgi:hypothetical protein
VTLAAFISLCFGALYAPLQPFDLGIPNQTIEGIFTLETIRENLHNDTYVLWLSSDERDTRVIVRREHLKHLKDIEFLIFFISGEKLFWLGNEIKAVPCKVLLDWREL